jgi:chromosome segregation ATPase
MLELTHLFLFVSELHRKVVELEEKLEDSTHKMEAAENLKSHEDEDEVENAKLQLQTLLEDTIQEKERLRKENNRLNNALRINEIRVKTSLQDQMTLQQQLHVAEDELISTKAYLETLRKEIETERYRYKASLSVTT